jgi:transposase InsO family protein
MFREILERFGVEHRCIPPASPIYNSDVESFHGTIELELFDYMKTDGLDEFLTQVWFYMTW